MIFGLIIFGVAAIVAQATTRKQLSPLRATRTFMVWREVMIGASLIIGALTVAPFCAESSDGRTSATDALVGALLLGAGAACGATIAVLRPNPAKQTQRMLTASYVGETHAVVDAVKNGARIDEPVEDGIHRGDTALEVAAFCGNAHTARTLLDLGAKGTTTAAVSAVRNGNTELLRILLERDRKIRKLNAHAILESAESAGNETAKALLMKRTRRYTRRQLGSAAAMGDVDAIRTILRTVKSVRSIRDGSPALHAAITNAQWHAANYLLRRGARADPRAERTVSPLFAAAERRKWSLVRSMLARYPAGDVPGLLSLAVPHAEAATIRAMLDHGISANSFDAIAEAITLKRQDVLRELLLHSDATSLVDSVVGRTLLWPAARANNLEAISQLMSAGVDPKTPDHLGYTVRTDPAHGPLISPEALAMLAMHRIGAATGRNPSP